MPIGSSSVPGLVNQPARAKAGTDAPAPNALLTERGDLPPGGDFLVLQSDSSNSYGFSWAVGVVPPLVAVLPSSPIDGQEVYFLADAANGIIWHLRFRAGSPSALKWEYLGGPPLSSEVATSETTTSASYTDLATVGPSITPPLAMDAFVSHGCRMSPAANVETRMSYTIGANGALDIDSVVNGTSVAAFSGRSVARTKRQNGLTALPLTAKYILSTSSSTNTFSDRWMTLLPIRVG